MTSFQTTVDSWVDQGTDYPDEYPSIGFNPAPGAPADLDRLGKQVQGAADGLAQADRLLTELHSASSSAWQGDAAQAFRSHVNTKLAPDLEHAQESLTKAVGVLTGWYSDLTANKQAAQALEEQARQAREVQQRTDAALGNAMNDPGLGLAGRWFTDPSELQRARATYQLAAGRLQQAETDSQVAANDLKAIIDAAKDLEKRHFAAADRAADELRACTNHLAPHKPGGFWHSVGSALSGALGAVTGFVKDHLKQIHDVLSTISAISGLLALVTPPPANAIFAGVAFVSGAGALATDLADPNFRKALLNHDPGAILTAVGDVASVIPGAGAAAKSATSAIKAARAADKGVEVLTLSKSLSAAAKDPGLIVKGLTKTVLKVPGTSALTRSIKGVDDILQLGYKGSHALTAADRIGLIWKAKSVATNVKNDIADASR